MCVSTRLDILHCQSLPHRRYYLPRKCHLERSEPIVKSWCPITETLFRPKYARCWVETNSSPDNLLEIRVEPQAKEFSLFRRVSYVHFAIALPAHLERRWIPDNVSVSLCSVPPVGQTQARAATSCLSDAAKCNFPGGNCISKLHLHPRAIQTKSQSSTTIFAVWKVPTNFLPPVHCDVQASRFPSLVYWWRNGRTGSA